MVHKKYTYKNGKRFGPYYYETKRVDGRVVTTYLGKGHPSKKKKSRFIFPVIILAVLLLFIIVLSVNYSYVLSEDLSKGPFFVGLKDSVSGFFTGFSIEGDSSTDSGSSSEADSNSENSDSSASVSSEDSSDESDEADNGESSEESSDSSGAEVSTDSGSSVSEKPNPEVFSEDSSEPSSDENQPNEPVFGSNESDFVSADGFDSSESNESDDGFDSSESNEESTGDSDSGTGFVGNKTGNKTIIVEDNRTPNQVIGETLTKENFSLELINVSTVQFGAVLGQPVKWKKRIEVNGSTTTSLKVEIPKSAENVSVNKILKADIGDDDKTEQQGQHEQQSSQEQQNQQRESSENVSIISENNSSELVNQTQKQEANKEKTSNISEQDQIEIPPPEGNQAEDTVDFSDASGVSKQEGKIAQENPPDLGQTEPYSEVSISLTGEVVYTNLSAEKKSFNLISWLKDLFDYALTGLAIIQNESVGDFVQEIVINISPNEQGVEVEYYTGAPDSIEEDLPNGKRVNVTSPSDVHYENVLVFTNLSESLNVRNEELVKIYWREGESYVPPESVLDLDDNGIYDYIEWVTNLSNQSFDIIVIIKAEHLDSNRNFISDIFKDVRELDGNWSETIPDGDYVRVIFERNLTNSNDITIYPRFVNGTSRIEIYEFNGTEVIAEFTIIEENNYNKIFLDGSSGTGLQNRTQDTFDLKIIEEGIQFDHIIDPAGGEDSTPPSVLFVNPTPANGSTQNNADIYVNLSTSDDSGEHYAFTDFGNDVVLWMRMDDLVNATVIKDLSSYGNNGTLVGIINSSSGYWGNGTWMDGSSDYILIGDKPEYDFSDKVNFSIALWLLHRDVTNSVDGIVTKGTFNDGTFYLDTHNSNFRWQVGAESLSSTSATPYNNIWTFLTLTLMDNGTASFYINATLINGITYTSITANDKPLLLGARYPTSIRENLEGSIDEALFFNRTLTQSEILALYNATVTQYRRNFTNLADGNTYNFIGHAVDLAGNKNSEELRTVTVDSTADTVKPGVTINFPANATYNSNNLPLNFNVTLSENGSVQYSLDGGINNVTMYEGVGEYGLNLNATNGSIADGGYIFSAYANDTSGNNNYTESIAFTFENTNLTDCRTLDVSGQTYILDRNLTTTATCFNITASHIVLDGRGLSILGDDEAGDYGINITSLVSNISVKNISIVDFGVGVRMTGASTSIIEDVRTNSSSVYGFEMGATTNLSRIITINDNISLYFNGKSSNGVWNATFKNSTFESIYIAADSDYNNFVNVTINGSGRDAVVLERVVVKAPDDNNFTNITVINTHSSYYDIKFIDGGVGVSGTRIINSYFANYTFGALGGTAIFEKEGKAKIKFLAAINGSGNNLTNDVRINGINSVTVESGNNVGLNKSANITLYGTPGGGLKRPVIIKDVSACKTCYNFTALTVATVIFNVTGFSNFSVAENNTVPIVPTQELNSTDHSNKTAQNLHCFDTLVDPDADRMNVTVWWYNESIEHVVLDYNSSYANNTLFDAVLTSGNTTKGENWTCGMRLYDGIDFSAQVNSSSLSILNTAPPVPTLSSPAHWSSTTDRNQNFSWASGGADDDGDAATYYLNLTCFNTAGGACSGKGNDDRLVSVSDVSHAIAGDLLYLIDNNNYYSWTVLATDSEDNSSWQTSRSLNISSLIQVSLPTNTIEFGEITQDGTNDTTDDLPLPFLIQNDGNAFVNMTIVATDIWTIQANPSEFYQYKFDNSSEVVSFNWAASITTFTDILASAGSGDLVALNYTNATDSVEADIGITVPNNEPSGVRNSTVTFTASLGE